MAAVKVLVRGYAEKFKDGSERASSTVTLITDSDIRVIVDPGMDRAALLGALKKEGLGPDRIDYVVLTHNHLDHCLLAGIFNNAKVLDNEQTYSFAGRIGSHDGTVPGTGIRIINTPGHDAFHCSVLAEDRWLGTVAIAGDVFWWYDGEMRRMSPEGLMKHTDPYVKDRAALLASRKWILRIADHVIPGHGGSFTVKK